MKTIKCNCNNIDSMKERDYLPISLDDAMELPTILTISTRKTIAIIDGLEDGKLMRLVRHYGKNDLSAAAVFASIFRSGCTMFYHKYNNILENLVKCECDRIFNNELFPEMSTSLTIQFKFGTEKYKVTISDADRKNIKWWSKTLDCAMMDLGSYLILKAISSATTKTTPQYLIDECIEKVTAFEHGIDAVIKIRTEILKIVV